MVRAYIRKSKRGCAYTKEILEAIQEVKHGRITAYKASKKYSIPMMAVNYYIRGKTGKKAILRVEERLYYLKRKKKNSRGYKNDGEMGMRIESKGSFDDCRGLC